MKSILLSLFALGSLLGPHSVSAAPPGTQGPRSDAEAQLLFQEGNEAFDRGDWSKAAYSLGRLVDRYATFEEPVRTRQTLGAALLRLGQPKKAIPHLLKAIETGRDSREAVLARLLLIRAYLEGGDAKGALVTALEVLPRKEFRPEALLLQARAQFQLGNSLKSTLALDEATPLLEPALASEGAWLRTEIKLRECAGLPGPGPHSEADAIAQLERRGTCLQEAALLAVQTLREGVFEPWPKQTFSALARGLSAFRKACAHPPPAPGKRSAEQARRYRTELAFRLKTVCGSKIDQAISLLETQAGLLETSQPDSTKQLREWVGRLKKSK